MNKKAFVLRVILCGATLALSPAAPAQTASGGQAAFEQAMADYERQHFAAAFDGLARLADAGHSEAARMALLMRAHGPRLYGQRFEVDAARRTAWLDVAAPTASPKLAMRWGALLRAEGAAARGSPAHGGD
jgi:hypothetical protein